MPSNPIAVVSRELGLGEEQVTAAVRLLDAGNTIPFIWRYRKDHTGALGLEQLQQIQIGMQAMRRLQQRREAICKTIAAAGQLTDERERLLGQAETPQQLEDLYLPFRPKRRTLAAVARQRGLEPLADALFAGLPEGITPEVEAGRYVDSEKEIASPEDALAGACHILAEIASEHVQVRQRCRDLAWKTGRMVTTKGRRSDRHGKDFRDFFRYSQPLDSLPPHHVLAINDGEACGALKVSIEVQRDQVKQAVMEAWAAKDHPQLASLEEAMRDSLDRLLWPSVQRELRADLAEQAERRIVAVLARDLRDLLSGQRVQDRRVMAIDPGYRSGCQLAVLSESGELLDHAAIQPHQPHNLPDEAVAVILDLCQRHQVQTFAIGNGTASRETEYLISEIIAAKLPDAVYAIVNEAGADLYAACRAAKEEFPDLEPAVRSAVTIGRRLLDPLTEFTKIEPQHLCAAHSPLPAGSKRLRDRLRAAVESCVNQSGVDLNRAGVSLLRYVAGLNGTMARALVEHRHREGPFRTVEQLRDLPVLVEGAFQQAAGFLRVTGGDNPLDATGVHPEQYDACAKLLEKVGCKAEDLLDPQSAKKLREALAAADLKTLSPELGLGNHAVRDIIRELSYPQTDPRSRSPKPLFRKSLLTLQGLQQGEEVLGEVRNVVDFGAFVDVGLKEDGLIHVSRMADQYVSSPYDILTVGQLVRVSIVDVDPKKGRVALAMPRGPRPPSQPRPRRSREPSRHRQAPSGAPPRTERKKRPPRKSAGPSKRPRPAPHAPSKSDKQDSMHLTYRPFADLARKWRDRERQEQAEVEKQPDDSAPATEPAADAESQPTPEVPAEPVKTDLPETPPVETATDPAPAGPAPDAPPPPTDDADSPPRPEE